MMNSVNQVAYEAAEPSSEQVTQESYQDETLSLMRYKELQFLAMSLNLPGNLKHKMLVEVIKARRANREGEVDRILAEHRGNRKAMAKRMSGAKEEEDVCSGGSDGRSKGNHRKRFKTQSPPRTTAQPAADPYMARLYGAYAYPMQARSLTPVNRSILANYLSAGPSSSVKNDWRYSSSNVYSSTPIQESTSAYLQADNESYKQIMSSNLSSTTVTAADSSGTGHRFTQVEKGCATLQQQALFAGQNYGNNYNNKHTLACTNQSSLQYSNFVQSSFISPQLSQSSSDSCYSGYQYAADAQESSRHLYAKKSYPYQGYGQQYLSSERFENRELSQTNVESVHPSAVNNYQSSINSSSTSWNDSTLGSNTVSQQSYRKYAAYGSANMWQTQSGHGNLTELEENSANIVHDLTVPSRRLSQEGTTNSVPQVTNQSQSSLNSAPAVAVNQAIQSPCRTQPNPYVEGRMESLTHSNKQVDTADQFVDHQTQRSFSDRMTVSTYHQMQPEDPSLAQAAASYLMKDKVEELEETPDNESYPENSFNAGYTTTNNDASMTYCHGVNVCPVLNQTSQYTCQDITPSASFSGSTSISSQLPPCSTCDVSRYPISQAQYQNSLTPNNIQSHITHSSQYSSHHGVNYGYSQSDQAISFVTRQNNLYTHLNAAIYNLEAPPTMSQDQAINRYFPEQAGEDNAQNSYTTQNSMESMWSSVRVPSPELDRSLLTPSPKGNGMSIVPDVCDSTSVFPDEADLEIGEDQSLSFPNIYDYVMSAAGDGSVEHGLELHESKGSSETGDSPSPGALQVVEAEMDETAITKSPSENETHNIDEIESDEKGETCPSGELKSKIVGEDLLNLTENSSDVVELIHDEKSEKSKDVTDKLKKKASKRKNRLNKEGSSLIQFHRSRRLRGNSPAKKARSKVGVHRDQMICPQGKRGCKWMGRIHGFASHVRSDHKDSIILGSDSSYIVSLKDLKIFNQVMFFQEAFRVLYLIAVHLKDSHLYITIQSLPGSGRSGAPPSGTKASLEVLLKNGRSQGWRGRIWGLVAPSVLYTQRPLSSSFLQEKLWSRGDCLSVDPSKVCDTDSKKFRLYVSITPPEVSQNSTQVVESKGEKSPQMSLLRSKLLTQTPPQKKRESIQEKESDHEETCSVPSNGNVGSSDSSPKKADDNPIKSPVLSSTPKKDCSES